MLTTFISLLPCVPPVWMFSFLILRAGLHYSGDRHSEIDPPAVYLVGLVKTRQIDSRALSSRPLYSTPDEKSKVKDFLTPSAELSGFQICIDKGTFDAISLNPDNAAERRKQYVKSLCTVLKMEGFFLVTSCNWTKEELLNEFREGMGRELWLPFLPVQMQFKSEDFFYTFQLQRTRIAGFEILEELPTPKFCFGGRIGNSVTALVFQRKKLKPSILDKLD
ncbi:EEF1A lysine methyltransferase 2 isoform X3 [Dermochelys coriacea]|uniref:EEF1A lysine methyltransferase 2 isoform X3 n=1 Tax=Dermochelys coriacea TaxID=27794 RepID=UPI001CA83A56|nr:EEF1A lysine methyltransferase 2 isoform X3 [Dermochelys coriacea]XP_043375529.1 EEF1A lysine methyltransferase 2 isoform X3 [Dermochelys coriacea]